MDPKQASQEQDSVSTPQEQNEEQQEEEEEIEETAESALLSPPTLPAINNSSCQPFLNDPLYNAS
jgi:hypothetical protein